MYLIILQQMRGRHGAALKSTPGRDSGGQNTLSEEQLKLALEEQKRSGRKLGRVFIEQAYVSEEQISEAIAR